MLLSNDTNLAPVPEKDGAKQRHHTETFTVVVRYRIAPFVAHTECTSVGFVRMSVWIGETKPGANRGICKISRTTGNNSSTTGCSEPLDCCIHDNSSRLSLRRKPLTARETRTHGKHMGTCLPCRADGRRLYCRPMG